MGQLRNTTNVWSRFTVWFHLEAGYRTDLGLGEIDIDNKVANN